MSQLKLAASKIPIELMDKLTKVTELTGLTQSAVIRKAIEYYLENAEITRVTALTPLDGNVQPSQLVEMVNKVNKINDRLTAIETRLTAIESAAVVTTPSPKSKSTPKSNTTPKSKKAPTSPAPIVITDRLTMKEAFKELGRRGYILGRESLRRVLEPAIVSGIMPDELSALGLSADFELRRSVSRFASNTRWLYFN